jgi:ribosomal protein S27E
VKDCSQTNITSQALEALRLRNLRQSGRITEQEYVDSLDALQFGMPVVLRPEEAPPITEDNSCPIKVTFQDADEKPQTTQAVTQESETFHRDDRFLESQQTNGVPSTGEYSWQQTLSVTAAFSNPKIVPWNKREYPPIINEAIPERFLLIKCPHCATDLRIYDHTKELDCIDCSGRLIVERKHCTIALHLATESVEEEDVLAALASKRDDDLKKLMADTAMAINVKRTASIIGVLCVAIVGYIGFMDMVAQQIAMGTSIFLCGSSLLATVICITRQTTKVRASLSARIREITAED